MSIRDHIEYHNRAPKPFIWTAKAKDILEKVKSAAIEPWMILNLHGALH